MGSIDIIKPLLSTDALSSSAIGKPQQHSQWIIGNAWILTWGSWVWKRKRYPVCYATPQVQLVLFQKKPSEKHFLAETRERMQDFKKTFSKSENSSTEKHWKCERAKVIKIL